MTDLNIILLVFWNERGGHFFKSFPYNTELELGDLNAHLIAHCVEICRLDNLVLDLAASGGRIWGFHVVERVNRCEQSAQYGDQLFDLHHELSIWGRQVGLRLLNLESVKMINV